MIKLRVLFGSVRPWWDSIGGSGEIDSRIEDHRQILYRWARHASLAAIQKIQKDSTASIHPKILAVEHDCRRRSHLLSIRSELHVLRHPVLEKYFGREELPKAICLAGTAEQARHSLPWSPSRQMLIEGYRSDPLDTSHSERIGLSTSEFLRQDHETN